MYSGTVFNSISKCLRGTAVLGCGPRSVAPAFPVATKVSVSLQPSKERSITPWASVTSSARSLRECVLHRLS